MVRYPTGKRVAAILTALLMLSPLQAPRAQEGRQYKLEAAFLYNFFNYITWPGKDSPEALHDATICVEAGDPLEASLDYVRNKMAPQRSLNIRSWRGGSSAGCQILFARGSDHLPEAQGTLTVTDGADLKPGAMVALDQESGRIAIRIDNSLLNERGFTASSRLLTLAQEVR